MSRSEIILGYTQHPALLASRLMVLFEPAKDSVSAVLQTAAIGELEQLCGRRIVEKDDIGTVTKDVFVLECKEELAKALATVVIHHMNLEAKDDNRT